MFCYEYYTDLIVYYIVNPKTLLVLLFDLVRRVAVKLPINDAPINRSVDPVNDALLEVHYPPFIKYCVYSVACIVKDQWLRRHETI